MNKQAISAPWYYRYTLIVASPLIILFVLREAWRRQGGVRFIKQRLGFNYKQHSEQSIWLHAASVGELNAAKPLLKLITKKHNDKKIIITTNTPSAARIAAQAFGDSATHYYLPLDYMFATRRFLNHIKPSCALIMETELWPTLFSQCRLHKIPICIINGRLSNKTTNSSPPIRKALKHCLHNTQYILTRTEKDRESFIKLGASPKTTKTLGNIKFSTATKTNHQEHDKKLHKPYFLAASTHANEEQILAKIWQSSEVSEKSLMLIVPRHPERRDSIAKQLKELSLEVAIRSRKEPVKDNTEVYLIDTIGELTLYMENAELVFMGGSLVPKGGQNVLEPAALGKAIITGPYTFNFKTEVDALLMNEAIVQIQNTTSLSKKLNELMNDSSSRTRLGKNAQLFIRANQNIAEKYCAELEQLKIIS